jgi:dienelactone hydrolase
MQGKRAAGGVSRLVAAAVLVLGAPALPRAQEARDVTIQAPDGTPIKGTYYAASRPGPGVLLLHMCNATRASWEPLGPQLAAAGIHALAIDYRGFGESGGERFDALAPPAAGDIVTRTWPGDIDAAYEFLARQPGVDGARIGAAGGSCGVNHSVRLARRHPAVRSLALLAGPLDVEGIAFLTQTPWLPIFAAAAADDKYDGAAPDTMRWILALSGNPRNRFAGYRDGGHGTEIFGRHPDLVKAMVAWFADTLIKAPADPAAAVNVKRTPVREFWRRAVDPGGVDEAVQMFYDNVQRRDRVMLFTEGPMNELGYHHLQAGRAEDAVRLFRLNTLVYPASANTFDSLADAYLAAGQHELALRMSERALELLPKDPSSEERKRAIRESAEGKIAKLKGAQK